LCDTRNRCENSDDYDCDYDGGFSHVLPFSKIRHGMSAVDGPFLVCRAGRGTMTNYRTRRETWQFAFLGNHLWFVYNVSGWKGDYRVRYDVKYTTQRQQRPVSPFQPRQDFLSILPAPHYTIDKLKLLRYIT
jgi:hypothetical protein